MRYALLCIFLQAASAAPPLIDAVQAGDRPTALKLIAQKVDINATGPDGATALHWAAHNNDIDLVDRLIAAGAKAKTVNNYGSTPLSEAAITGNAALIAKLLKAGADPDSPNADGETALMIVAR